MMFFTLLVEHHGSSYSSCRIEHRGGAHKLFGGGVLPFPLFSFMSYNEIGLVVMQIHEKRKY